MRYPYKQAREILAQYAYDEGFESVVFDHNDISVLANSHLDPIYIPRKIKIEGKYNYELQTYLMLHELGHHELRKDWEVFGERFSITVKAEQHNKRGYSRNFRRRKEYFVEAFEEEYTAWNEGLVLAEVHGIPINFERWNKLRTECLFAYMKYYSTLRN
jgi:hypothetical protein